MGFGTWICWLLFNQEEYVLIYLSVSSGSRLRFISLSIDVQGDRFVKSGSWDSIHIVEVTDNKTSATYKLTTTVMLGMNVDKQEVGEATWSGSLTRQVRLFPYSLTTFT
jgi:hypothetical protein